MDAYPRWKWFSRLGDISKILNVDSLPSLLRQLFLQQNYSNQFKYFQKESLSYRFLARKIFTLIHTFVPLFRCTDPESTVRSTPIKKRKKGKEEEEEKDRGESRIVTVERPRRIGEIFDTGKSKTGR